MRIAIEDLRLIIIGRVAGKPICFLLSLTRSELQQASFML